VDPRAGLDTDARGKIISPLPGIEPRSPGRPARSQILNTIYKDSAEVNHITVEHKMAYTRQLRRLTR
jgi:hypothetical protein